ncbi:MAG: S41 family peptidase, partial [Hyphomicrobiaceae bacterium]
VQTIIPLGQNGALRLTTARYYTPSGRSIQAKGIDPDVKIEEVLPDELKPKRPQTPRGEASLRGHLKGEDAKIKKKEESGSSAYVPKDPEKDTQLQYALKLLRGQVPEPTPAAAASSDDKTKDGADKADAAKTTEPKTK